MLLVWKKRQSNKQVHIDVPIMVICVVRVGWTVPSLQQNFILFRFILSSEVQIINFFSSFHTEHFRKIINIFRPFAIFIRMWWGPIINYFHPLNFILFTPIANRQLRNDAPFNSEFSNICSGSIIIMPLPIQNFEILTEKAVSFQNIRLNAKKHCLCFRDREIDVKFSAFCIDVVIPQSISHHNAWQTWFFEKLKFIFSTRIQKPESKN